MRLSTFPSVDPRCIRTQKRSLALSIIENESAKKIRSSEIAQARVDRQISAANIRREEAKMDYNY